MIYFLFSILTLVMMVQNQNIFRLNTKQTTKLLVDQSLISTLGLYKAILRKNNCSLEIFNFNQIDYVSKGFYYSPTITKNCSFLEIKQGLLITSQNQIFLNLNQMSFNRSTIFTIDDVGVMRLIGTYLNQNLNDQSSIEVNINTFYMKNKYIFPSSQLNVKPEDNIGQLQNERGWIFKAKNGQLDIFLKIDDSFIQSYPYASIKFNNSQIYDFIGSTFPITIFPDILFQPRCFQPRISLTFQPPFILIADPYWPKFTLMQQGGYKIFELFYAKQSAIKNQPKQHEIHYVNYFSQCPDYTFEHKGKCLAKCPSPYYHEMRGRAGSCRLICEQFTLIDEANRTCTCMNQYQASKYNSEMVIQCPTGSEKYPYGCNCTDKNKYFDRKLTFLCVDKCPNGTYGYQGLCLQCPSNCLNCTIDGYARLFLECKICEDGYNLTDGQCRKKCNTNLGSSLINGTCQNCLDLNCADCSDNIYVCKKCTILYTLSNGQCLTSCVNTNQIVVYYQFFSNICLEKNDTTCITYRSSYQKNIPYIICDQCPQGYIAHLNTCVISCPQNFTKTTLGFYSYCTCKTGVLINGKCLNITGCPIKMGFDLYSKSCLSCDLGCLTCMRSDCTSCSPGFFLYVSPKEIICERQSPLVGCTQQYYWTNNICVVKNYENNTSFLMTLCRKDISNCKVCSNNQLSICVNCMQGFYIFNNTCVKQCPLKHIIYKNISCILLQIQNCSIPYLKSIRQQFIINLALISKNQPYKFFTVNQKLPFNDPVGYIPYYQNLISRASSDGLNRQTSVFEANWTCLKCSDGYGMDQNFTKCLPCVSPCTNCYMARNDSCIDTKCKGYVDYVSKICMKSCNSTNFYPQLQKNILYCINGMLANVNDVNKIDSAIYIQPNGSKLAYFVFQNDIPSQANVTVKMTKTEIKPIVVNSSFIKVGETKNINTTSNITMTNKATQTQISKIIPLNGNNYFEVLSAANQDVFILDFSQSIYKLKSTQGLYPPNLVYGSTSLSTHPQFMKTWLSIIGQIMTVVIIAMHCIYIGNQLLYKMDNLIILCQTIYYFSFVKILVGKLLAQFYYGWIFSHLGFFKNFFITPDSYRENDAPISYKLATTDANFIRNAGYSLSFLIIFIGILAILSLIIYLIARFFHKKQIWYPRILEGTFLGIVQFLSMNIMYWAVAHLMYRGQCPNCDQYYHNSSYASAIFFILVIILYTFVRSLFNAVGGLYMAKRVIIAVILSAAFNNNLYLIPLVILELIFVIGRFIIQAPEFKKEKLFILTEFSGNLIVYCLLFLCENAGVNTIIISIIVFIFIVALMSDFMHVYLQSVNEWELEAYNKIQSVQSNLERARTNHSLINRKKNN